MSNKLCIRSTLMGMLITSLMASGTAFAVDEVEPNDTPATAQKLVVGSDGTAQVNGAISSTVMPMVDDIDFYSFHGYAGDVVTLDIDGGMDATCTFGVDTSLFLLAPDGTVVASSLDVLSGPLDDGSPCFEDPIIVNKLLDVEGDYIIAVTGAQDTVVSADSIIRAPVDSNSNPNGPYTLLVSGVVAPPAPQPQPQVQAINIEVRPGSHEYVPLNPNAKGTVPVALLSSKDFNALTVDRSSLTFGEKGDEKSLVRCNKDGSDVNGDKLPDLICHFDIQKAQFQIGDTQALINGTNAGKPFTGQGVLKVLAGKGHRHHKDKDSR